MTERRSHRHMANARYPTFEMRENSPVEVITIKAMLYHITAFGDKRTKAPLLKSTNFGTPACNIRVDAIRATRIRSLQQNTDLLTLIWSHLTDAQRAGQRELWHR